MAGASPGGLFRIVRPGSNCSRRRNPRLTAAVASCNPGELKDPPRGCAETEFELGYVRGAKRRIGNFGVRVKIEAPVARAAGAVRGP